MEEHFGRWTGGDGLESGQKGWGYGRGGGREAEALPEPDSAGQCWTVPDRRRGKPRHIRAFFLFIKGLTKGSQTPLDTRGWGW